jgi:hypothetical protein
MLKKSAAMLAVVMLMGVPAILAGTHTSAEATVPFVFISACTGDTITGVVDVTVSVTGELNANTLHLDIQGNIHGTGTGSPSGASYIFNSTVSQAEQEDVDSSLTGVADIITNVELIGQGGVPNEKAVADAHLTINADGTITVLRVTVKDNCLG